MGRPVGGYCWVVNSEDLSLAPTGCIGEVMIQGPTLLREYLADKEKTEATITRFLPSWAPMQTSNSWNRFYKSGDLCFVNSRGVLEFSSRKDNQIKIRGLRVELGEVEYIIRQALPGLSEVAVDVHRTEIGTNLVAFLRFAENGHTQDKASSRSIFLPVTPDMRERLSIMIGKLNATLPGYMIPALFVPCSRIPFITSTKIDRVGLRTGLARLLADKKKWDMYALQDNQKRKPQTPMEHRMKRMFADILKLDAESIGRDDSFLRLGGDSVTAIHLVAAAREQGVRLTVKTIFDDARLLAVSARAEVVDELDGDAAAVAPFGLLVDSIRQLIVGDTAMSDDQDMRHQYSLPPLADIDDAYPCTPMQEGLMSLTVKQPGSYVFTYIYKLAEHVDERRFRTAWEQTVWACPNLRTRIFLCGNASIQVIVNKPMPWVDVPEGTDLREALRILRSAHMGYGSPLCRYALITQPDGQRYFVWAIHHAVFDGWTMQLMLGSLLDLYKGLEVSRLRLQPYSRFVKHAIGVGQDAAKMFWQQELEGAKLTSLPWSSSSARPTNNASRTFSGRTFEISQSLASTSTTKATVLRAAWSLIMARYSESGDVCFGATVTGRQAPVHGVQAIPGMTIATVPVRVRTDIGNKSRTASAFLQDIQRQATEMVAYEQFGLQNIARLGPDASDACAFSSLLVIQPVQHFASAYRRYTSGDSDLDILRFGVAEQELLESNMGTSFNYPLVFVCEMGRDNDITPRFYYDAAVLNEAQLEAMCYQFEHVVQQLVDEPDAALDSISLVGPWEAQQAVAQNEQVPAAIEACTHWRIQEQFRIRPQAPAIMGWDASLTYSRLGDMASRLALKLQHLGIGPDMIVPLCFPKSAWAVVAMVAVQVAGAAFVPLDPGVPIPRNKGILDHLKATVALTTPDLRGVLLDMGVESVVEVDQSTLESLPRESGQLENTVQPANASYAVFTSGSTGKPKGILVDHKAACSSAESYGAAAEIGPHTRLFQFSSIVFDVGIFDNLVTLMRGGCVCIPSDHDRLNNLAHAINSMRANFVFLTPTVADMLSPAAVPGLKTLVLGGEAVGQKTIDRWPRHVKMIGLYGPAETTAVSALNLNLGKAGKSTNIGRPLSSAFWVVEPGDPRRLVPTGCVGELLIQGPLLARGYIGLGSGDKAASAWLDNVDWFSDSVGGRAYLTGDLVRRNENGTFDFVGRKDTQIKIHGQRVELGEIQTVMLAALPEHLTGIVDVVKGSAENSGPDALVAFIWAIGEPNHHKAIHLPDRPSGEEADLISSLHGSLGVSLPPYMVPAVYLCLRGTPEQTVSGKVSRRHLIDFAQAIPAQQRLRFAPGETQQEPPSTAMELALRKMWVQILKVDAEQIGKQSNFLRLGGDSLSAIQLVTAAREHGVRLTVASIFHDPRLVGMAAAATTVTRKDKENHVGLGEPPFSMLEESHVGRILSHIQAQCGLPSTDLIEDAYPCSAAQAGYMSQTTDQPFSRLAKHVFPLAKTVDLVRFKKAWEQTVTMCPILRTRIVPTDRPDSAGRSVVQAVIRNDFQWQQGLDHLDLPEAIDAVVSHGVGYGRPLCRYAVVQCKATGGRVFVVVLHHSVFDGWAMKMFYRVLNSIYLGLPIIQTTPFTRFIKYTLDIDHMAAQTYWREQLQGARPSEFPCFITKQGEVSPSTAPRRSLLFSKTIAFPDQCQQAITKATIFRAAWAVMLARHNNTDDVTFGAAFSGRKAPLEGIDSALGPAIAYAPVRVRLPGRTTTTTNGPTSFSSSSSSSSAGAETPAATTMTTTVFLHRLQTQAADMVAHEQYGVDMIARASPDARSACEFRHLLIIQPVGMWSDAGGPGDTGPAAAEGRTDETIFDPSGFAEVAAAYPPEVSLQHFYGGK